MANQIVLAWTVDVANTTLGPAGAAAALGAVPLYHNTTTDPVLGQNFGLTVASDASVSGPGPTQATRTLTLNMNTASGVPFAPPPFPCRPRTSTPPVLPYPLRSTKTLPGSFFVSTGATNIPTSMTQLPSLIVGESIQFLKQEGVFYVVAAGTTATSINLTAPYTGVAGNSEAFKEIQAPVAFNLLAVFSTSDLDTSAVATVPPIPAGSGAQIIELSYRDSTGAGPFAAEAPLTGRRPAAFTTLGPVGIDIAEIVQFHITSAGGFANSVGEITLVELESALPVIQVNATPFDFLRLTDEAQLLINRHLVYLPPSYFALAQQGASAPQLAGDFILTTGQTSVPTTVDQTAVLAAGNVIRFAEQDKDYRQLHVDVLYTISAVSPKYVTLDRPFTGVDNTNTGTNQEGTNSNQGTKGNLGSKLQQKPSGAFLVDPSPAAPPTNTQLSGPLAQFVALETAAPPPVPPGAPATVPTPTFLSGLFTRTLQLALAGVPVVPQPITFI